MGVAMKMFRCGRLGGFVAHHDLVAHHHLKKHPGRTRL
jgi:hypothetical protein